MKSGGPRSRVSHQQASQSNGSSSWPPHRCNWLRITRWLTVLLSSIDLRRASETARRIERLPTEVGVLLLTAGITIGLLPPPPGPFDLTIMLSGGLVLWPRGFRAIEWLGWQALPESTPGRYAVSRSLPGRSGASLPRLHRVLIVHVGRLSGKAAARSFLTHGPMVGARAGNREWLYK